MVLVPTREADGFDLHPDEVERRITDRTKAILLISPGNPTAGTITPPNVRRLAEIARYRNLLVISDEIYEKLLYDDTVHLSIGSQAAARDRTVTINGFSKTYCMTGWRLGYVAGPTAIMTAVAERKQLWSGPAPTVSQIAAIAALDGPTEWMAEYREIYHRRRRIVLDALDRLGFSYGEPRGGFYVYLNASSVGLDAYRISELLLDEAKVLLLPGTAFGDAWANYMRLAFLAPEEQISDAMSRMEAALGPHLHRAAGAVR
jgi:aminotransferase